MNVTSKITVDMTRQNVGQRVNAVQGDGNTRLVEIILLAGGDPWTPPEGVEAAIAYMQPGGTKGMYNLLADGTAAISMAGNVATIILAPQMLTASGTVQASLVFNDSQLNRLTTFPFAVSVTSNPAAGAQKVEDYLRLQWLEDKLDEYLRKAADSGAFDGKDGAPGADGHTPEYGVDYGTPEQISGISQKAAEILKPDVNQIKQDLSAEQTAREQADTSLQQEISGKLPKSPANWEPWTAEEQAAARERMGINEEFQRVFLLNEIWEEGTSLIVDVNSLSHLRIFIELSPGIVSSVDNYGLISFTDSNGKRTGKIFELGALSESNRDYDHVAYCKYDINDVPTMSRWA